MLLVCRQPPKKFNQSDSMKPRSSKMKLPEAPFWSFWKLHFGASRQSLEALKWSFQGSNFRSFKIELPASKLSFSISSFSKRASRKARAGRLRPKRDTTFTKKIYQKGQAMYDPEEDTSKASKRYESSTAQQIQQLSMQGRRRSSGPCAGAATPSRDPQTRTVPDSFQEVSRFTAFAVQMA